MLTLAECTPTNQLAGDMAVSILFFCTALGTRKFSLPCLLNPNRVESEVNSKIKPKVNSKVESKVESKAKSKVGSKVRSKVGSKVESKVEFRYFCRWPRFFVDGLDCH